jgi:tetratricopeptide (TPR) repeat protein
LPFILKRDMRSRILLLLTTIVFASFFACESEVTEEGDSFFNEGKYSDAIESYTVYLATRPKDIKTLYNRGRAYEEIGQVEKARADFIQVLNIQPNNVNANLSMGKYWYNKKSYAQAINFFDKVLDVDGRVVDAYLLKGRSYHQQGEFEDAMINYNQAIDFDRLNEEAFLYRGALKVALNQKRGACNDLQRAKGLGSKDADAAIAKHCM